MRGASPSYERKEIIMKKYIGIISVSIMIMLAAAGCRGNAGKDESSVTPVVEDFDAILNDQRTQVIVRDEVDIATTETTEEFETETAEETETEAVTPYADRIAGDNAVTYSIETAVYEDGVIKVAYPQLAGMADGEKQQNINENIKKIAIGSVSAENIISYELKYETATKGAGMVSFIFRGTESYGNSAYSNNVVKTLNIDLNTGNNVRLKDFADIALIVSSLELADGYTIINEDVDMADFSGYLNNGSVTDYAVTLLDYDIDFGNPEMITAGFSAIRDNHLILFIKAEHSMGDYVELEFGKNL